MNENARKIDRWAAKSGWIPGSHLHNGMFLVSRTMPDGMLGAASRDWRLARIERNEKGTRVISVDGHPYELQRYARNALERALAEKGISPLANPTKNLKGVRCFPYTALDQGARRGRARHRDSASEYDTRLRSNSKTEDFEKINLRLTFH